MDWLDTCKMISSPIFTELSIQFAQNDQPVKRRGWMTSYTTCFACKVIMTSQANTPKSYNLIDYSNFLLLTSEKYLFGTYRRKIINIYCPLVTEKSTNPHVKLTYPCLRMNNVNLTLGLVDFSVTTGQHC